jgi:uncharacterized membrane protein
MRYLERAALAGIATGMRSTSAVAALIVTEAPGLPELVRGPVTEAVAELGVISELILDKLPSTPSRLEPPGLAGRAAFASVAGLVIARGAKRAAFPAVFVASVAALVSARVFHDIRQAAATHLPPSHVAMVEDALALRLAAASART